jgi:hypothetical protein
MSAFGSRAKAVSGEPIAENAHHHINNGLRLCGLTDKRHMKPSRSHSSIYSTVEHEGHGKFGQMSANRASIVGTEREINHGCAEPRSVGE